MPDKQFRSCKTLAVIPLSGGLFRLDCLWPGPCPRPGQFFMLKPKRSARFLPRPLSAAFWEKETGDMYRLGFLVLRRGAGTEELAALRPGEEIALTGPLGNSWETFTGPADAEPGKPAALVGGGVGIAPLLSLPREQPGAFDFFAGFKNGFVSPAEQSALLGPAEGYARKLIIAAEEENIQNLSGIRRGRITDFFNPAEYRAVCACGPEAMLQAVAEKCRVAGVPCYVSMERRMACGVGACLGCTVNTSQGNRRCCVDGPVFNAGELGENNKQEILHG